MGVPIYTPLKKELVIWKLILIGLIYVLYG
jgi:hypothetical protein